MKIRPEVSLVEGRMFRFGTNEIIVGKGAQNQFEGLDVGDTAVSGQNKWVVVGVFEADGGVSKRRSGVMSRICKVSIGG